MKTMKATIVIAICIIISACSTSQRTTGSILPYPIIEVTDATAFYDGGTTVIHFVLADGSHWGLMMNMNLEAEGNPDVYKAISISQNDYSEQSKIKIRKMDIKIGSKEEYEILSLLYEFRQKCHRKINSKYLYYIDGLLKDKEYCPTSAWTLRGKTHNFHA